MPGAVRSGEGAPLPRALVWHGAKRARADARLAPVGLRRPGRGAVAPRTCRAVHGLCRGKAGAARATPSLIGDAEGAEPVTLRTPAAARKSGSLPPVPDLPTDAPRPKRPSLRAATHVHQIGGATAAAIASASQRAGTTPLVFLAGAFAYLIGRLSGAGEIALRCSCHRRTMGYAAGADALPGPAQPRKWSPGARLPCPRRGKTA